jgi:hypothetical protein
MDEESTIDANKAWARREEVIDKGLERRGVATENESYIRYKDKNFTAARNLTGMFADKASGLINEMSEYDEPYRLKMIEEFNMHVFGDCEKNSGEDAVKAYYALLDDKAFMEKASELISQSMDPANMPKDAKRNFQQYGFGNKKWVDDEAIDYMTHGLISRMKAKGMGEDEQLAVRAIFYSQLMMDLETSIKKEQDAEKAAEAAREAREQRKTEKFGAAYDFADKYYDEAYEVYRDLVNPVGGMPSGGSRPSGGIDNMRERLSVVQRFNQHAFADCAAKSSESSANAYNALLKDKAFIDKADKLVAKAIKSKNLHDVPDYLMAKFRSHGYGHDAEVDNWVLWSIVQHNNIDVGNYEEQNVIRCILMSRLLTDYEKALKKKLG